MLREEVVFGPIQSRRLGTSLGLNLLPTKGKFCNFDCIYCECGWNKDGTNDKHLPTSEEVHNALEEKLKSLQKEGTHIDSITFSGDGESTINPQFPQIIDDVLALRDKYCPDVKVSVLSNATRVHIPSVFEALCKVDNPIMKIDAPTDALVEKINHPYPGYEVKKVVEALGRFNGNFVLQTMFLKSSDFDSSSPEVINGWTDIVKKLNPREIMIYTVDRPAPTAGLYKFTLEEMLVLATPVIDYGYTPTRDGSSFCILKRK